MPGTSPRDDGRDTAVLKAPQIKALAERLLEGAMLAAERAVAQLDDPSSQAFPRSARSLEAILLKRLRARPAASQRAAKAWLATRRAGSRHRHVAAVNLGRATAVMVQLRKVAPASAITLATLKSEGFPMPLAAPLPAAIAQQNAYSKIALRIGKLRCVEETDGSGDDEITLTGIALRPTGKSKKLAKIFNEALFTDSGEGIFADSPAQRERSFSPPKAFARFRFADDDSVKVDGAVLPVTWPRRHSVMFMMAEIDNGGFPGFVKDIFDALSDEAVQLVAAGVAGILASASPGGPLAGIIVAALVWVAMKITEWLMGEFTAKIISIYQDDAFLPWFSNAELNGTVDPFSGQTTSERAKSIVGHGGRYRIHYDWHLEGAHVATPMDADILNPGAALWRPAPGRQAIRLELAMRGMDRGAFRALELPGGWSGWGELPPDISRTFLSAPAMASWAPGRLEFFALSDDARIWQNSLTRNAQGGESWSGWQVVAGDLFFRFGPAAVSRKANTIDLFAVAADRRMYRKEWNGQQWTDWQMDMPSGTFMSGPAVTASGADSLDVVALGDDRRIYHAARKGGANWANWGPIPVGKLTSAPAICHWDSDRLHVFARGDDRQIHHARREAGQWSGWALSPGTGTFLSGPAAVSRKPGLIDLFAVGDDRRMWRCAFDGFKFSGWFSDFGADTFG